MTFHVPNTCCGASRGEFNDRFLADKLLLGDWDLSSTAKLPLLFFLMRRMIYFTVIYIDYITYQHGS